MGKMLFIENESTEASFHFAAEEYCMSGVFKEEEPVILLWQTDKCVMLGANQIVNAEINVDFAEETGIGIVRRSSGGGAIFADSGTLLYSVILPLPYNGVSDAKTLEYEHAAVPIVGALGQMGVSARIEGRNDILLDGCKISGIAQFARKRRICTHASLLYNTDLEILSEVLRPDDGKILSKAIRSVRNRVDNIAPHMNAKLSMQEFRNEFKNNLLSGSNIQSYSFTDKDIANIEKIKLKKYANPKWTYGNTPHYSFHNQKRYLNGKVEVFLDVVDGVILSCRIRGDFLSVYPIREFEKKLEFLPYRKESLAEALKKVNLEFYLGRISQEEILRCLY
jgi:lipoate-protein ligase A